MKLAQSLNLPTEWIEIIPYRRAPLRHFIDEARAEAEGIDRTFHLPRNQLARVPAKRRDQASLTAPMIILTGMILPPRFCFSHRDHSLLREAVSSSTCRQAKVVVTSPIA